jgi:N-methylhydantoinase B
MAVDSQPFDPITLEIHWNRLITLMNETDTVVVRTSFSTIVGEARDFACILVDEAGFALAQSTLSSTSFTFMLPRTVRYLLSVYPPESLVDGDILLTNDPWQGAGHLPDFIVVKPVFRDGRVIAYLATAAHVADVGGRLTMFESRDLFEEGLQLPPCKIYKAGVPNEEVLRIIEANVRVPDQVVGDVFAIVAAESVGAQRLLEFMDDYGYDDLRVLGREIHARSEAAMRDVLLSLPDGEWHYELQTDGYVQPVTIVAKVTIQGDDLHLDFAGTSPQTSLGAVNCALNATLGDAFVALKCAFAPHIPNNDGLFRPITINAPRGSILNCDYGMPVRGRSVTAMRVNEAIYGALSQLVPDRVQAGTSTFWGIIANARRPDGRRENAYLLLRGGKGAVHSADGLACLAWPGNGTMTPVEVFENRVPVRIEEAELLEDSGGPGKYRGGQGQRITLVSGGAGPLTISLRPNNVRYPTPGFLGGGDAPLGYWEYNGQRMSENDRLFEMNPGDRLTFLISGGGGFYSARERDPDSVRRDVLEGRVSPQRALTDYGVRVDPAA